MKINFEDRKRVAFDKVREGGVFETSGGIFMRVDGYRHEDMRNRAERVFNAVDLASGKLCGFLDDEEVRVLDAELFVIV